MKPFFSIIGLFILMGCTSEPSETPEEIAQDARLYACIDTLAAKGWSETDAEKYCDAHQ